MGMLGCGCPDGTATRRGTGPRGQGDRQVHGGIELGPGEAVGDPGSGHRPGSGSSPRAAPHGAPTWRTRHPPAQNLQCSTTHADPSHRRMAKNSWHRLLAATTELNITGIDRAAGPAAGRAGEAGPGTERGWERARPRNPHGNSPPEHGGNAGAAAGERMGPDPPRELPAPSAGVPWAGERGVGSPGSGPGPPRAPPAAAAAASRRGMNIYGRLKIAAALCFPLTCGASGVRGSC